MKLKLVIAVGFFALFGLINQPFVSVPVRITTYSLVYPPSMLASAIIYWYYDSTMEAKQTVLTTAAKSVVAWHAVFATSYYGQITTMSFWSTELEDYWNNTANYTCITILPLCLGPTFFVSLSYPRVIKIK